jgi:O-antigen/teichoic acid export membrane protein
LTAAVPQAITDARPRVGVMKNTSILAGYAVFETVVVFLFQVMIARYLGPESFGRLGWALTYALLTSVWSDPGISIAMTKLVATSHGDKQLDYVANGVTVRAVLTSVVFLLALIPCAFVPYMRQNAGLIVLILIAEHMRNMALYFCGVFRGHQQNKFEALSLGTERLGALLLAWPLLFLGFGIRAIAWVYVAARAASLLVALTSNVRAFGWRPLGIDRTLLRRIFIETMPLAVLIICERTNMYLPPLLVKAFSNEHALGIFNAAFKSVYPAVLMCTAVAGSLYAPMAARFHADPAESARLYRAGLRGLMHLLLPAAVITLLMAPQVTMVLYGPEYAESSRLLQFLTFYYIAIIFIALNHLFMPAINRQRVVGAVSLISVAVNAGLAVLFISRWGAAGAALSLAAAQVVIACVYVAMARRFGKAGLAPREWFTMSAAFLLAAGALYLVRPYLPGPGIPALLSRVTTGPHLATLHSLVEVVEGTLLSVIVYVSFLFGLDGVSVEERRMFSAVWRRLAPGLE